MYWGLPRKSVEKYKKWFKSDKKCPFTWRPKFFCCWQHKIATKAVFSRLMLSGLKGSRGGLNIMRTRHIFYLIFTAIFICTYWWSQNERQYTAVVFSKSDSKISLLFTVQDGQFRTSDTVSCSVTSVSHTALWTVKLTVAQQGKKMYQQIKMCSWKCKVVMVGAGTVWERNTEL